MFEVTEKASSMLKNFLEQQKGAYAVRILMQAGWGGPSLGMALDEPQGKDVTFKDRGITFAVDKDLFEEVKPICVDFMESVGGSSFKITSSLASGGGCGDSCGC